MFRKRDPGAFPYRLLGALRFAFLAAFIGWAAGCAVGIGMIIGGMQHNGVLVLIWISVVTAAIQALIYLGIYLVRRSIRKM